MSLSVRYEGLLAPTNDRVRDLERILLMAPQIDMGTQDLTHGGMHLRWIFIPAGTVLTGATTNLDNVCLVAGDIEVTTEDGPRRLTGFHVLPARRGAKRAGFAHADTWWATVWRTDLHDLAAIEDEMTDESAMLQTRRNCLEEATSLALEG